MDVTKPPEDDGLTHFQRLSPDHFDVVLGTHPGKLKAARAPSSGSLGRTLIWLAALGIGAYVLVTQLHTSKPAVNLTGAQPVVAAPSSPIAMAAAPVQAPEPAATPAYEPSIAIDDPAPSLPQRSTQTPTAQGMVSASYMASFKSDLQHSDISQRRLKGSIITATLREWDGRNRYRAQWRLFNNKIDNDSVCFNFPSTSIEHRECRKAAQVFFKEQCRDWTKRWNNDREEQSKATELRYCEAAGSFDPAG